MSSHRFRVDLLAIAPVRAVLTSAVYPFAVQVVLLAALIGLAANGFGLGLGMDAGVLLTYRKTNLTTLVVWGLWWPGLIVATLAFGRIWCAVCPLEAVHRIGDSAARVIGWRRLTLSKPLRDGWLTVALYLLLQVLVAVFSVHRVPHLTAVMLVVMVGLALVVGFAFDHPRAFCRAFCPARALLSVYGRYSPLQVDVRDTDLCARCQGKECTRDDLRFRFHPRSCPSMLRPFAREASDGCNECLQCAAVCPHDNVGLGIVPATSPARRILALRPFEAAFVWVVLGFVAYEVTGETKSLESLFLWIPSQAAAHVPALPSGWSKVAWNLAAFPVVFWSLVAGLAAIARGHGKGSVLIAVTTGAAPMIAVAHAAKAMAKVTSWGGFLPLAVRDPRGLETLRQLAEGSVSAPSKAIGLPVLGGAMLAVLLYVGITSVRWTRHAQNRGAVNVGLVAAGVLFGGVLMVWIAGS